MGEKKAKAKTKAKAPNKTENNELWERMKGEGPRQYEHFAAYRDMKHLTPTSSRSIRKLAKERGMARTTFEELSVKFNWVARCEAYDLYLTEKTRLQNEADIEEMRKNHALLGSQMIRKAAKRLLTIPEEEITASDIVRLVDAGVKIERLSRGESTENRAISGEAKIKHEGQVKVSNPEDLNLSKLSNEELEELEGLLEKLHPEPGV